MKKILAAFLAMLLALTGVVALAGAEDAKDTLVVGSTTALSGDFFTDMWGNNTSDIDVRMLLHGYNLVTWKSSAGTYELNDTVVQYLIVSEDGQGNREYTITLKRGLTYSDGTPITAKDYIFSILLSAAPEMAEIGAQTTGADAIVGAEAYRSGEADVLSGVRIVGKYRLSVAVKADYVPHFYEMALLDYSPYPIHVIAPGCEVVDDGQGVRIANEDGEGEPIFTAELLRKTILDEQTGYRSHPSVVSGPYTLVSFDEETRTAEFAINPKFRGNAEGKKPSIKRLVVRTVSNDTMMEELAQGTVDLINKCTSADAIDQGLSVVAGHGFRYKTYPRTGYSFMSFCTEQKAVSSQSVRQAIAYCLDKDTLVKQYVGNYGVAVDGYYGVGQWVYQVVSGEINPVVNIPGEYAPPASIDAREALQAQVNALKWNMKSSITTYDLDLEAAAALLEADGWTLNRAGESFGADDDVRCKKLDGEIVPLELTMIYPEGNAIGGLLQGALVENLAKVGVALTVEPVEMTKLLDIYYRNEARECDMIYLATNFATVFDPSETFNPSDAYQGVNNRTAIADEQLYRLAVDMRQTNPGDVLTYCQRWIAFQARWTEVLPAIPVYSNTYYDFFTDALKDYNVTNYLTWSQAIVGAKLDR